MPSWRTWAAAVALTVAARASDEDFARPPLDCWTMRAGCAARTAWADTEPLVGPVAVQWRVEVDGELEGEPLVWDGVVVLAVRDGDTRELELRDLDDGVLIARRGVGRSDVTLAPSVWGRRIAVRADVDRVEVYAWHPSSSTMSLAWDRDFDGRISEPLLLGDELYVRAGPAVERHVVGAVDSLVWQRRDDAGGELAVRGDSVYLVRQAMRSRLAVRLDRASGERTGTAFVGDTSSTPPRVAVLDATTLVDHGPEPGGGGLVFGAARRASFDAPDNEACLVLRLRTGLARTHGGWIAVDLDGPGGLVTLGEYLAGEALSVRPLADETSHPRLTGAGPPPSSARHVAYVGGRAVDVATSELLWTSDLASLHRPVPTRGRLLLVTAPGELTCLGPRDARRAAPITPRAGAERADVVLADGSVRRGVDVEVGGGELRVTGRRGDAWPLDDVTLVRAPDGALVHAADDDAARIGLRRLRDARAAETLFELADDVRKLRVADLAHELLDRAERIVGPSDDELVDLRRLVDKLRRAPTDRQLAEAEELFASADGLLEPSVDELWALCASVDDADDRIRLLDDVLALDPSHPGARDAVRTLLPDGVTPPADFDALEWLAFAEACRVEDVTFVDADTPRDGVVDTAAAAAAHLVALRASWRPDLTALRTDHLLVMSAVERPGTIARFLVVGELVCETLEAMFADGGVDRSSIFPLELHLFGSRDEYLARSAGPGEVGSGLDRSAGHFDPSAAVSRMFVPEGDAAFDEMLDTYAHELTHHWVEMQCPAFTTEQVRRKSPRQPGFWIVEGFASLIGAARFDVDARTCDLDDPRAERLDVLANAPPDALIPWDTFFALTHERVARLPHDGVIRAPSGWLLGVEHVLSVTSMFYCQAEATCRALYFVDDGAHRDALLAYLTAYYTGDVAALDIEAAFGMAPDDLGAVVMAYTRATQDLARR